MLEPEKSHSVRPFETSQSRPSDADPGLPPSDSPTAPTGGPELKFLADQFESISKRTLDSVRTIAEDLTSQIASLEKRSIDLEVSMSRIRNSVEAIQIDIQRLLDTPSRPSLKETAAPAEEAPTEPERRPEHVEQMIERIWDEDPPVDEGLGEVGTP